MNEKIEKKNQKKKFGKNKLRKLRPRREKMKEKSWQQELKNLNNAHECERWQW